MKVGGDAAHIVVRRRQHRDRPLGHVDAGEDARKIGDAGQPLGQHVGIEMVQMQMDVVLVGADAAALPDLDGDGAGDDVARGEILGVGRVALHEVLAFGIAQEAAFAARAFGDQHARAIDAGRVELHELHVLQREPGAQHHGVAVAGADMRGGAGEIGAAIAAGGEDHLVRAEAVQRAVGHRQRHDAAAAALVVHDQVDGEIFDEELGGVAERLAIHGVQHGVAGAVGRGAGAQSVALAELGGHAAEGALQDLAVVGAREGHAPMLELVDGLRRVAAEIFDGVLVAEPVRALDRVVHVPAPVVGAHIAERRGDAALGGDRVRAGGEHLGDAGGAQARLAAADHGAQACAAGADHHDIVSVVFNRIGAAVDHGSAFGHRVLWHWNGQAPRLIFRMAKPQARQMAAAKNVTRTMASILAPSAWT